jgi:hypothetical protein
MVWSRSQLFRFLAILDCRGVEDTHPEIQARGGVAGHAEGSAFHGLDGMRGWWADLHDAFARKPP